MSDRRGRDEERWKVLTAIEDLANEILARNDPLLEAVLYKALHHRGLRMGAVDVVIQREVRKRIGLT